MNAFRSFLNGLSRRAKWAFAVGVLTILVVSSVAMWWALHPEYTLLTGNLKPADASEIASTLAGWGVPYQFGNGDQSILVPDDQVYPMRMKLAAEGIPKGGDIGFAAFKGSDYGVTEFAQQVNYQLALQGELERTIDAMREVESARVHLTIQHPGLFQKDQEPSKASVALHVRPDYLLAAAQVTGIQRLVASAVEGLKPSAVTVLDQDGSVLSVSGSGAVEAAGIAERETEAAKLEDTLRAQITSLLFGVLHRRDFTVSVAVQLNYAKVKRVQKRLLAQGKGGNGLLIHERTNSSHAPGNPSATNQESGTITSRDVEYAHGTLQEEVDETPGRLQRISVGVVVPGTLSSAEIKALSKVISAGIGLDPSRGDRIDIAAIAPSAVVKVAAVKPIPLAPPIARSVATPHDVLSQSVALLRFWSKPMLIIVSLVVVALLLLLLAWQSIRLRRGSEPRCLTQAERAATLEQLMRWIEQPERTP